MVAEICARSETLVYRHIEYLRGHVAWHFVDAVIATGSLADFPMRERSCAQRKHIAEQTQQSAKIASVRGDEHRYIGRRKTYIYAVTKKPPHDAWACGPWNATHRRCHE